MRHLLYLTLIVSTPKIFNADWECDAAYGCIGANVTDWFINCDGFKACTNAVSLYSYEGIWCNGGFACTGSEMVEAEDELYCKGSGSCSNISLALANTYSIDCEGANACQYSRLEATIFHIRCYAEFACYNTYIVGSHDIYSFGAYALVNSIINSTGAQGEMWVTLQGWYAGYNLNIYCTDGHTCRIKCYGKSCINTRIICANERVIIGLSLSLKPLRKISQTCLIYTIFI